MSAAWLVHNLQYFLDEQIMTAIKKENQNCSVQLL